MVPESDRRVDELRQQLKALGYLDAGVDRFVLGAANEGHGPLAVALRASLRVGLLGGALLGPAAALGVGARLPGLVSGARDAVVLAVYLAIFFLAAVTAVACCVSVTAAAAARRGRFAVRGAGRVVTIGSLLYFTLWWRNANAGFGWSAPLWTSFALVVAVAISLLLGHAVRIATLAVLAARNAGTSALPPVTTRSWRVVVAGGVAAFTGASALLLATVRPSTDAASPRLAVVNSYAPIRLIAIDGFDPATYERLKDHLPNLRTALGGPRVRLQPQDTSDPARAWTTIATGLPPALHGVHAIETRRVAGLSGAFSSGGRLHVVGMATDLLRLTRPSVASAQDRKVKTMWEVAEQAGLRTAVVNWWATWPANPDGGLMITDRGLLRLEHGGNLDAEIGPPALYDTLRAAWPRVREQAAAQASAAFADTGEPAITATLRRSAELDATLVALLRSLPPPRRDFDVIYLPGLDIAQNSLLPATDPVSASSVASRVDALEKYYAFLDGVIAPLLERKEHEQVMILTQPGRVRSSVGGLLAVCPDAPTAPGDVSHAASPAPDDVAPTVLYALGLPLSRELAGSALPELFPGPARAADRFVPSYGRPLAAPPLRRGAPLDQETIDRLRSLGYIK